MSNNSNNKSVQKFKVIIELLYIYSNNLNNQLMPGIAISDISEHYPVFALIPSVKHFKNNAHQIWKRDMKNLKLNTLSKT